MDISYLELRRLITEIRGLVEGSKIENVYQMDDGSVILKLWNRGEKFDLRIVPGTCLYVARDGYEKPPSPTSQAVKFRRILRGSTITEISLLEGERIVKLKVKDRLQGEHVLVAELLPRGTVAVLGPDGKIVESLARMTMRDRRIAPGETYLPPPARKTLTEPSELQSRLEALDKNLKVVVALAAEVGMGRRYAEEVLRVASVDKNRKIAELSPDEIERIKTALAEVMEKIGSGRPVIVEYEDGEMQALPYLLETAKDRGARTWDAPDLNEAIRITYERTLARSLEAKRREEINRRVEALERELTSRQRTLQRLTELSERKREIARLLLSRSAEIEEFKRAAKPDEEKVLGELIVRLDRSTGTMKISTPYGDADINLRDSVARQASSLFDEAKSVGEAIKRLRDEIAQIEEEINRLKEEAGRPRPVESLTVSASRREERRAWFEKFRWFQTSEGFLAVAGRDASSNVMLVKRYLESSDLVFHAEVRGSPILLLKNGAMSGEESRMEAAQFTACYSRAWREGLQSISVYYVKPDQVSLTPPPGHYVPKGGVIIKGEKNYLTVRLELGIGVSGGSLVWGPFQMVSKKAERFVKLVPGKKRAEKIAEEVVEHVFGQFDENYKEELKEKIIQLIPYGCGELHLKA